MLPAEVQIVRADPAARRRAIQLLLAATLIGTAALQWGMPWLLHSADTAVAGGMPRSVICRIVLIGLAVFGCSTGAFGVYAFRFGRRVAGERRFPPRGVRVIRDTCVREGHAAEALGTTQAMIGVVLVAASGALVALAAYGFAKLSL